MGDAVVVGVSVPVGDIELDAVNVGDAVVVTVAVADLVGVKDSEPERLAEGEGCACALHSKSNVSSARAQRL